MSRTVGRMWRLAWGLAVLPFYAGAQNVITTVAGTAWIFPDEGKQAIDSAIGRVLNVATDSSGSIYLADIDNSQVMKITKDGAITVFAGNGLSVYSGDGGPARNAGMWLPDGIVAGRDGSLYIATTLHHRIRRVSRDGVITVVAGNGRPGFSGDGGPAADASLFSPKGLAMDADGNLYVADSDNHRIRRISADGIITTVAGNGVAGFGGDDGDARSASLSSPAGVAVDASGNLLIADTFNHRVRRVRGSVITTLAGIAGNGFSGDGGPATAAALDQPSAVAVDKNGRIYIADSANHRVRVIDGAVIGTFAGNGKFGLSGDGGPAVNAALNYPAGLALDADGNLFIADFQNSRVRMVGTDGRISSIAGSGRFRLSNDNIAAATAVLSLPTGIALDRSGNVYFTENQRARVRKMSPDGSITTVIGNGFQGFSGEGVPATTASLFSPSRLAIDAAGNLYVSDNAYHRVRRVSNDGLIRTVAGTGQIGFAGDGLLATAAALNQPEGIAVDENNNLYIADQLNNRVRLVSAQGIITTVAGTGVAGFSGDGGPATSARLDQPTGVAVISGKLYIAERGGNRVRMVAPDGTITTIAGTGVPASNGDGGPAVMAALNQPGGVAIDAGGNVYIAELLGSKVRRVAADGTISTLAGNGAFDYTGDGGPPDRAALNIPTDVKVDASGNLYIADAFNNRVREVLATGTRYQIDADSLSFHAKSGGAVTSGQVLNLVGTVPGLLFSAAAPVDESWLRLSRTSGTLPTSIEVAIDPGGLAPGTYTGTITVTVPAASPATRTVSLVVSLDESNPPKLSFDPDAVQLTGVEQGTPVEKSLLVANRGGGELSFEASSENPDWLAVVASKTTATPNDGGSVRIVADPSKLTAGDYAGRITLRSATTSESFEIPVALTVIAAARPKLLLSQTGLSFRATAGGADLDQCFAVLNAGEGQLQFTVSADQSWLIVQRRTCPWQAISGASTVPEVVVNVRPGALGPGEYNGKVIVSAPEAETPTAEVAVKLTVLPTGQNIGPLLRPSGLVFLASPEALSPGSLDVNVINFSGSRFDYNTGVVTSEGGAWVNRFPDRGTSAQPPAAPAVIRVAVTSEKMGSGNYYATLTMNTGPLGSRTTEILLSVASSARPSGNLKSNSMSSHPDAACSADALSILFTQVSPDFRAAVGSPFPLEVYVADACGLPLVRGSVVARLSNGDRSVALIPLGDGRWAGTWNPAHSTDSGSVTVTVQAESEGGAARGLRYIDGRIQ